MTTLKQITTKPIIPNHVSCQNPNETKEVKIKTKRERAPALRVSSAHVARGRKKIRKIPVAAAGFLGSKKENEIGK